MGEDEERFGDEVETKRVYGWEDKYKPRKPRFFNRVKCGFDWNKYNQTHYDKDTPPPKYVLGYKFNLFYPDFLIRAFRPSTCSRSRRRRIRLSYVLPPGLRTRICRSES